MILTHGNIGLKMEYDSKGLELSPENHTIFELLMYFLYSHSKYLNNVIKLKVYKI
jgi:hypothetical protein